jgi:3-methyladenine DNA glycosylase/8-oxoguanine DNA glycosylase
VWECEYRKPVDVRATLGPLGRGPYDPTTRWEAHGVWRTFRTPLGAATAHIAQEAGGTARVRAWGSGAEWVIAGAPRLLGADDDWSALDVSRHPLLQETRRRNPALRLTATRRVLEALVPAVIEQKVTSLEAYRSWARLVRWFGEPAPGPGPAELRVIPDAEGWRRIPSWEWHRAGVDPRRSQTVIRASRLAESLERSDLSDGSRRLRTVPGIGGWTAAETTQRSHGDPDAVSFGDYHLAHYVGHALTGSRVDDDGMRELLEPWAGQRQRVVRLVLASGVREKRMAPRAPVRDYRRI